MERQCSVNPDTEEDKSGRKKAWFGIGDKKEEDEANRKKTQAQRLFEFELWTDGQTLRDLEYSQRRTEKKQRRQERKKAARNRCWKKLYLPAMVGMLGGTVLTLCGTLRSMGGDSVLWEARGVLTIVGPVVICLGFLALMLAAGCTFEHDKPRDEHSKDPFLEYLMQGSQVQTRSTLPRPPPPLRSVSMDTADLPIPEDLDPSKNYVVTRPDWPVDRNESIGSTVFLDASNSYASTASWVKSVSASHSPRHTLTRQNSDSNLLAGRCGERHGAARRSLHGEYSEMGVAAAGSHSELHVVCTRSLTSSGYQSASDSTGPAECHLSSEHKRGVDVVMSSASPRHASRSVSSDTTPKSPIRKSNLPKPGPDSTGRQRLRGMTMDSERRPGHAEPRRYRGRACAVAASPPSNPHGIRASRCDQRRSVQDRWRAMLDGKRNEANPRLADPVLSCTETSELTPAGPPNGSEEGRSAAGGRGVSGSFKQPVALEPIVYMVGSLKSTEV